MLCPSDVKLNKFHNATSFRDEKYVNPEVDLEYCESTCTGISDRNMEGMERGCEGIRKGCETYKKMKEGEK